MTVLRLVPTTASGRFFLRLRHSRSPLLQELPATTNQPKTRANTGSDLAHAREVSR